MNHRQSLDPAALAADVLRGNRRAAGRLLTLLEDGDPCAEAALAPLFAGTGRAQVVGVTGPPGAGKSTLVSAIVAHHRAAGATVGVVAVDPSSPFTGGALLGDRIRLGRHATDAGVFVRSMASRGCLGGVALATSGAVRVLDAMGLDVVVVETVGAGQSEVGIMDIADCTLLVTMPSCGDAIQMLKAGIMEIGDIFVVNKADLADADRAAGEIAAMLRLRDGGGAPPLVLKTRAHEDQGIVELVGAIDAFLAAQRASGAFEHRRARQVERETLARVTEQARRHILNTLDATVWNDVLAGLRQRRLDPIAAARRVLAATLREDSDSGTVTGAKEEPCRISG